MKFLKKWIDCCSYAELYRDGILVVWGDYYHDKIDERIEGYLQAYKDLGYKFEYTNEEFEKCPNGCNDEYEEDDEDSEEH